MKRSIFARAMAVALRRVLLAVLAVIFVLPVLAAPATEQLVTTTRFGDIEFDWARDGVHCPTCNDGDGNARFNWVDRQSRLWVAYIDFDSGFFYPPDGRGVLVDNAAAYYSDFGNGPEWAVSDGNSQLVYTRYTTPGAPPTSENTGIGLAKMVNGSWTAGFVPRGMGRVLPGPSQNRPDAVPLVTYASIGGPRIYWRTLGDPVGKELSTPWIGTGLSVRWVPDPVQTTKLAYVNGVPHEDGNRYQQVFLFDTVTNTIEQLTFDATEKRGVFMFPAPEFGGEMVFFTVAARTQLRIYRNVADASGKRRWTVVNTIRGPASQPYIATPERFFYNGRNWIFMTLSRSTYSAAIEVPTDLAVTGIDPAKPSFRMLTDQTMTSPERLRQDPEYFITANGAYLYFTRAIPGTDTSPPINEGVFRVDMGLGPPKK